MLLLSSTRTHSSPTFRGESMKYKSHWLSGVLPWIKLLIWLGISGSNVHINDGREEFVTFACFGAFGGNSWKP